MTTYNPRLESLNNYVKAVPYDHFGPVYVVSFTAVAVTAAQDVFELNVASTLRGAYLREVRIGQYSDAGDTAAEMLSVLVIKGYTVTGSGGGAFTPVPIDARSVAASSTAAINNTTVANTGTALTLVSDAFNIQAGWLYQPGPSDRPRLAASDRLVVRITIPADSLTMNGTLVYEELL